MANIVCADQRHHLLCEKKALSDLDLPHRKLLQRPRLSVLLPEVEDDSGDGAVDEVVDVYSSDEFRMYEFKVRRCMRGRSHDWTDCPFAHPGEKARRRDPRRYHYSGAVCPEFRRSGSCPRGDACELAHGVFECWLHPARYRTMPCKDGRRCRRKICFFAHFPRQLRILPSHKDDETNYSQSCYGFCSANDNSAAASGFSPTSTLMSFSPPISPSAGEMHYDSKQMNFGLINRYIGNNTGRVIDYDVVCEELMNSLDAMELSASPATSPAAAAPTDARGEWAVKGGNSSSSMCWPDLEWVNELLM
ncbi:zinc finger CCCH domain-containing protein 2-like [Musa acuminata AAA Group]|uniref:zinc finger CCCH domain-containing protein 2-like n=1 Tax=Musa acuminata AAA Group TaxID=214697 RepID=UPI0031DE26B1